MLNVIEDKNPTTDKIVRFNSVTSIIESKRVKLLRGAKWIDNYSTELTTFPNATHDDLVDVTTMAINKLTKPKKKKFTRRV